MKVGFWNVERLGASSTDASKTLVANVVEWFFDHQDVELFVLCEITSNTTVMSDGDTETQIDKVGSVRRRLKRAASAQLGYALVTKEDQDVVFRTVNIDNYKDVYNFDTYVKSGNVFSNISKRNVMEFNRYFEGIDLYFYHANASYRSQFLVAWASEFLRLRAERTKHPFVLIGDFNCHPSELTQEFRYYDNPLLSGPLYSNNFRTRFGGVTYKVQGPADRTYDYAVTNTGSHAVTVDGWDTRSFSTVAGWLDHPDHFPITVSIA